MVASVFAYSHSQKQCSTGLWMHNKAHSCQSYILHNATHICIYFEKLWSSFRAMAMQETVIFIVSILSCLLENPISGCNTLRAWALVNFLFPFFRSNWLPGARKQKGAASRHTSNRLIRRTLQQLLFRTHSRGRKAAMRAFFQQQTVWVGDRGGKRRSCPLFAGSSQPKFHHWVFIPIRLRDLRKF